MDKKELFKKYTVFIVGLFLNALGICFIIKADLGSSPISSLPYTISLKYPISLGTLTFILNLFLILGQLAIQRRDFKQREWGQLPVSVLFGFFVDLCMSLLGWVTPATYLMQLVTLLSGCLLLGLGVSLEVIADVIMLSGEAFVNAYANKRQRSFGTTKIMFDTTLMILSCITSLFLFLNITGVREGTVIAALTVGMFARFFNKKLSFLQAYLTN